jgi:hypothetical protein
VGAVNEGKRKMVIDTINADVVNQAMNQAHARNNSNAKKSRVNQALSAIELKFLIYPVLRRVDKL